MKKAVNIWYENHRRGLVKVHFRHINTYETPSKNYKQKKQSYLLFSTSKWELSSDKDL